LVVAYPLRTYSAATGNTLTYRVPLYKVIVSGTDSDGNPSTREYSATRFGVYNDEFTDPYVSGLSDGQGPYSLSWNTHYGGSWQIMGLFNGDGLETYYIHNGASGPNVAVQAIGCVGVAGPGAMVDFNSYVMGLSGTSGSGVNATVTFLPAGVPPLVYGPQVGNH